MGNALHDIFAYLLQMGISVGKIMFTWMVYE